jgi:hypothetical protein
MLNGIKEIFSGNTLKVIGKSALGVIASKSFPGVAQNIANRIGGTSINFSGPAYALASATLVAGFLNYKKMKTEAIVVMGYAVAEQGIFYINRGLASTLPAPLVLPATTNAGLSDYTQIPEFGMSDDGVATVQVPNAQGVLVDRQVEEATLRDFTALPPVTQTEFTSTPLGLSNNPFEYNYFN